MRHRDPDSSPGDLIEVYRDTVHDLYEYVSRRCGGCRTLAEDVTQETYLRAVKQWKRGAVPDEPLAWLRTVARNLLVSHYRRRRPDAIDPDLMDSMLNAQEASSPQAVNVIHWGLGRLGRKPARLLEAFHLDGKPIKSIARETGLSERAVEGRLHRARQALRKKLEPLINGSGGKE